MRFSQTFLFVAAALLVASCETTSISAPGAPSGPSAIPGGALELGDWRHAPPASVLSGFETSVAARYGEGQQLTAVAADLRSNQFACAANHDGGDRGDPPAQICRKTVTDAGCTHTWQVHLFDTRGDARLARTRGLYDRRCAGEGLLGGPS